MTMMPVYKKCPRCNRRFLWNPDTGQFSCPQCGHAVVPGMGDVPMHENKEPYKKGK